MSMDDMIERDMEVLEMLRQQAVEKSQRQAAKLQAGHPGECDFCGEDSPRLINGACGRCRDTNPRARRHGR